MINIRRLGQAGVSKADLRRFCSCASERVQTGEFFSSASLRYEGFDDPLYGLGFGDMFYNNVPASDSRFSSGRVFGSIILRKGAESFTVSSFLSELIRSHGSTDLIDFADELREKYGIFLEMPMDVVYKMHDTSVFYDDILGRVYADIVPLPERTVKGVFGICPTLRSYAEARL